MRLQKRGKLQEEKLFNNVRILTIRLGAVSVHFVFNRELSVLSVLIIIDCSVSKVTFDGRNRWRKH